MPRPRAPLLRPNREDRRRRRQGGVCGQRCARGKAQDRRHVSRSTPSSTTWSRVPGRPPATRSSARSWRTSGGWARAQLPLASPKLAPHRALQYAVEFWPYVMNVLEDGAPGALEQRRRAGPANLRRRAQELALQRCAARRAGVCGDIQRHHHGQGQRAQSQALRRVAADRDAQRRRAHR